MIMPTVYPAKLRTTWTSSWGERPEFGEARHAAAGLAMVMVGASREHVIAKDAPEHRVRAVVFGVAAVAVLVLRLVTA
jgi:hypothetical protein